MELKSLWTTDLRRLVANDSYVGKLKRKIYKKDFDDDISNSKIQRITESSTR